MTVRTDRQLIRPSGRSRRHVLADIEAPKATGNAGRRPVNVAIVLDRSGSMGGEKIRLAHEAAAGAVERLQPVDRFTVVVFDQLIDVLVPSTYATPEAKFTAINRLRGVSARGTTNLFGGWQTGADEVVAQLRDDTVSRIFLLTDGHANVGTTDPHAFVQFAAALRARGIRTSTFGVGADFDEVLLQQTAQAGGGHFYFIERAVQIPDVLSSELGDALEVVAREAALIAEVPEGVGVETVQRFRTERLGQVVRVDLDDLVSEQQLQVVLKLTFPAGQLGSQLSARFHLTARDASLGEVQSVTWTYASAEMNNSQPRDRQVDRAVATFYAARARQEALELNRQGAFRQARAVLERVARRIRSYGAGDPVLEGIARALEADREAYAAGMDVIDLKARHFASHNVLEVREADGKARKRS